jgi:hypothetical protein
MGNKKQNKKEKENEGGFRMMRKRLEPLHAHRPILGFCTCNSYLPSVWSGWKTEGGRGPRKV